MISTTSVFFHIQTDISMADMDKRDSQSQTELDKKTGQIDDLQHRIDELTTQLSVVQKKAEKAAEKLAKCTEMNKKLLIAQVFIIMISQRCCCNFILFCRTLWSESS